jgi:uncharacterized protein (DUF1330 family)
MTTYFVAIRLATTDEAEMAEYGRKAALSVVGREITPLAAYGELQMVEGDPAEGALILAFPDFNEAREWYDSGAYQDAVGHRFKGARYQTFFIQGVGS